MFLAWKAPGVFALEGLDGVGKTTAGEILADQTGGVYLYCMDRNKMRPYRKMFDTAPVALRFLYYLTVAFNTYKEAERLRQSGNVFVDRAIASTIAYHRAFGLEESWLHLVPDCILDQIDTMILLTVNEGEREKRLGNRSESFGNMTFSDLASFDVAQSIDREYRLLCPEKTIIVCTDNKSPQSVVNEIRREINL